MLIHDSRNQGNRMSAAIHRTAFIVMIIALLFEGGGMVRAQGIDSGSAPTIGTEYYVTFLYSDDVARGKFMGLLASAQTATIVQVEIPNGDGSSTLKIYDVMPGQITTIPIPASVIPQYVEEVAPLAVHVTSRAPIALYAVNDRYQTVGATPVLPVSRWGLTYLPVTLPNALGAMTGEIAVIAAYDSTVVTVIPSARILFQDAGRERTITLNRGDVFLMKGVEGDPGRSDLSGSEIISWSRPIGLVAGHVRTPINADGSVVESNWSSHVMSMPLPDSSWGNEHYTIPMRTDRGDRYRITAARNGTSVTATHFVAGSAAETARFTINRGQMLDVSTLNGRSISGPVHWQADAPLSVVQLRLSGPYGSPSEAPAFVPSAGTNEFSSRTVFVAPSDFGGEPFPANGHELTVLVLAGNGETEASILNALTLDASPFAQAAKGVTVRRIGGENVFVVSGRVGSGGHVLTAANGRRFLARLVGIGDATGRDFYAMTLPFWLPQAEIDDQPPFMIASWRDATQANVVNARISDNRAPAYFSGLWSVRIVNSPGWEMQGTFTPPNPDDETTVRFRATADPSGPLFAELQDRDGNIAVAQISEGICVRTAAVDRTDIMINAPSNDLPRTERVVVAANLCGDQAHVDGVNLGVGSANPYVALSFIGRSIPFTIDAHASDTVELTVQSGTPQGTYTTSVVLRVDGFTFTIPVTITVGAPSGAPVTGMTSTALLSASIYPNPVTSSAIIVLSRPLGRDATLAVIDPLGRLLFRISGDELAGRSRLVLNGVDGDGDPLASGTYLISIADADGRLVRSLSIVR